MNFLAHDAVLPAAAPVLVRVATALPDLFRLLPTPPLPLLLVRELRRRGEGDGLAVARGIRAHLLADATFHRHPLFLARVDLLAAELPRRWPALGEPELAAHILVEMLLDQWLISVDPTRPTGYAAAFAGGTVALAAHHAAADDASRAALARILTAVGGSPFREDYADPARFAARFERAWQRSGFPCGPVPEDALADGVERWARALAPGFGPLLADVTATVAADEARAGPP